MCPDRESSGEVQLWRGAAIWGLPVMSRKKKRKAIIPHADPEGYELHAEGVVGPVTLADQTRAMTPEHVHGAWLSQSCVARTETPIKNPANPARNGP